MGTKLETLKTILEIKEVDKEVINDLILNYYNNQNEICFETLDGYYYVYDIDELDDEIYNIAEEKYDELEIELRGLSRRSVNSYDLGILLDHINRDKVIQEIENDLDNLALEEHDKVFIIKENNYFIYKET